MIQQDYIMRLIREFFAALAKAMEKDEIESRTEAIHTLYEQYLGSYERFQNTTAEEAIDRITLVYPEEQHMARIEMLAELYYAEADIRAYPISETLLERAMHLFEYIDMHSGVYSVLRLKKIEKIREIINSHRH